MHLYRCLKKNRKNYLYKISTKIKVAMSTGKHVLHLFFLRSIQK